MLYCIGEEKRIKKINETTLVCLRAKLFVTSILLFYENFGFEDSLIIYMEIYYWILNLYGIY